MSIGAQDEWLLEVREGTEGQSTKPVYCSYVPMWCWSEEPGEGTRGVQRIQQETWLDDVSEGNKENSIYQWKRQSTCEAQQGNGAY